MLPASDQRHTTFGYIACQLPLSQCTRRTQATCVTTGRASGFTSRRNDKSPQTHKLREELYAAVPFPRIAVMELFGVIGSPQRTVEQIRLLAVAAREREHSRRGHRHRLAGRTVAARTICIARCASWPRRSRSSLSFAGRGLPAATWSSCAATKIVALPTAMVGSIGVISIRPLVYDLLDKLGVKMSRRSRAG